MVRTSVSWSAMTASTTADLPNTGASRNNSSTELEDMSTRSAPSTRRPPQSSSIASRRSRVSWSKERNSRGEPSPRPARATGRWTTRCPARQYADHGATEFWQGVPVVVAAAQRSSSMERPMAQNAQTRQHRVAEALEEVPHRGEALVSISSRTWVPHRSARGCRRPRSRYRGFSPP